MIFLYIVPLWCPAALLHHTVTPKAKINFKQPSCCCHSTKISHPPQKSCIFFEDLVPYTVHDPMLSSTAIPLMSWVCALHGDSKNRLLQ
jgi:hypothetical protein